MCHCKKRFGPSLCAPRPPHSLLRTAPTTGRAQPNPLMEGAVGNTGTFIAVKAGVGVATIMAAERLWKTNKVAAIAVMVASNSVSAVVAARNARTLRQLR